MATTTTNYGFDVPTSSDLVKNGATAISTLGQDIDTFLFRPFTRNAVLNSSFNVWQRGTSFSLAASSNVYTADRWQVLTQANNATTISRQSTNDTTNLPNIQYCMRYQRNSGQTGTGAIYLGSNFETLNSIPFSGKTVTFSFYARAGANYSATSNALTVRVSTGSGTDQNIFSGYTGEVRAVDTNATLTTTWQRFTYTGTVPSTSTEIAIYFMYTPTGTAGANDYYEVTGVQLEVGNQASPYTPATPTYATELAACQRYYEKTYAIGTAAATNTSVGLFINYGGSDTIGNAVVTIPMQVAKRNVSYSVAVYTSTGTANSWSYTRSGAAADATMTIDLKSERTFRAYGAVGANFVVANMNGHWVVDNEL